MAKYATTQEAFEPVVDEVLAVATAQARAEPDWVKLTITMKAVETVVGVQKGARTTGQSLL